MVLSAYHKSQKLIFPFIAHQISRDATDVHHLTTIISKKIIGTITPNTSTRPAFNALSIGATAAVRFRLCVKLLSPKATGAKSRHSVGAPGKYVV
jgi:hypothetical protein